MASQGWEAEVRDAVQEEFRIEVKRREIHLLSRQASLVFSLINVFFLFTNCSQYRDVLVYVFAFMNSYDCP